jgi:hypothetical protein
MSEYRTSDYEYILTAVYEMPRDRDFRPPPKTAAKKCLSDADALDAAEKIYDEEEARRRRDPRRLPILISLKLIRPDGSAIDGTTLRRAAYALRD